MAEQRDLSPMRFKHLVETEAHGALLQEWDALWSDLHQLAEWDNPELPALLQRALHHPSWYIRTGVLELLGFHYDLSGDMQMLNQIRTMLLSDTGGDGAVRLAAVSVLGVHSQAWDESLVYALADDPDEDGMFAGWPSSPFFACWNLGPATSNA